MYGTYRPISLLNGDLKVLSEVLAQHLQRVLSRINWPNGFHSFKNMRRILSIISSPSWNISEAIISLDAQKAFSRVEWGNDLVSIQNLSLG